MSVPRRSVRGGRGYFGEEEGDLRSSRLPSVRGSHAVYN